MTSFVFKNTCQLHGNSRSYCLIFKNFFWPQCLVKTGSFGENDRLLSGDTCRTSESRFCNGHFMSLMNALISFSQGNKTLTKREKKKLAECSDYIQDVLKSKKVRHTLALVSMFQCSTNQLNWNLSLKEKLCAKRALIVFLTWFWLFFYILH